MCLILCAKAKNPHDFLNRSGSNECVEVLRYCGCISVSVGEKKDMILNGQMRTGDGRASEFGLWYKQKKAKHCSDRDGEIEKLRRR